MRRRFLWMTAFAAAFAYVESAVVVYLRELYYPAGFRFPIVIIPDRLAGVELGREAATILILLAAGALAGSDKWERFLWFAYLFGAWDIFYYVWLWVFLGWPPSLLTWDILFLIPVPWLAPVLAPVLIAAAMVAGSLILLRLKARGAALGFSSTLWALAVAGGVVVFVSFTIDFHAVLDGRMPSPFLWWLYGTGFAMALAALTLGVRRLRPAR